LNNITDKEKDKDIMKLNMDKIRSKIASLNDEGRTSGSGSDIQLWKPKPGKYVIRGMHWPTALDLTKEGEPFVERYFYYGIKEYGGILAPYQFGEPDPVHDLRIKLFKTKDANDRVYAKKLFPKLRCYMPIIVKEGPDASDEQVYIWSFNPTIYEKLLGYFMDGEVGDWLDPEEGFNLKVSIKKNGEKKYFDTDVELARNSSPILDDGDPTELFESIPDVTKLWKRYTTKELEAEIDKWLSGGSAESDDSEGTEKGTSDKKDALDELKDVAEDNNTEVAPSADDSSAEEEKPKAKKKKTPPKRKKADDEPVAEAASSDSETDLESAFDDLMDED
jgi:hypothetical protein